MYTIMCYINNALPLVGWRDIQKHTPVLQKEMPPLTTSKVLTHLSCGIMPGTAGPILYNCSCDLIRLIIPKVRTEFGQNSFHFAAANDWKSVQNTLKLTDLTLLNMSLTSLSRPFLRRTSSNLHRIAVHCCTQSRSPTFT